MRSLTKSRRRARPVRDLRRSRRQLRYQSLTGGAKSEEEEARRQFEYICTKFFPIIVHLLAVRWNDPGVAYVCRKVCEYLTGQEHDLSVENLRNLCIKDFHWRKLPNLRSDVEARNFISQAFHEVEVMFMVYSPEWYKEFDVFEIFVYRPGVILDSGEQVDEVTMLVNREPAVIEINWDDPKPYRFFFRASRTGNPEKLGFWIKSRIIDYSTIVLHQPMKGGDIEQGKGDKAVCLTVNCSQGDKTITGPRVVIDLTLRWPSKLP